MLRHMSAGLAGCRPSGAAGTRVSAAAGRLLGTFPRWASRQALRRTFAPGASTLCLHPASRVRGCSHVHVGAAPPPGWEPRLRLYSSRARPPSWRPLQPGATPPVRRGRPQLPHAAVWMLLGANVTIFTLCQLPDPVLHAFMARNFMLSPESVASGRYHTLISSCFVHINGLHLVSNMLLLAACGTPLPAAMGSLSFLSMYVVGGVISSCSWVVQQRSLINRSTSWQQRRELFHTVCIGASGAVSATVMAMTVLSPFRRLYVFGILPLPAFAFTAPLVLHDVAGLLTGAEAERRVAHVGHLGGALVGAVWIAFARLIPGALSISRSIR